MAEGTRTGEAAPDAVSGADIRTFLFADIRGYTRFTDEHGDDAASALAGRFADLVNETVPRLEGELLELRGDEALCVFRSARQALRASVELQRRLRTATDEEAAFPIGVGMGLDAGEAVPTHGGYRGASLNLAARLCALAKPGEILATENVAHFAHRVDGLRLLEGHSATLRGMARPVRYVVVEPVEGLPPAPDPPSGAGSGQGWMGRRAIAAIALAVVVAAGTVVALVAQGTSGSPLVVRDDALVFVGSNGRARSVGSVGAAPSGLAVGGGRVWVSNRDDGTVTELTVKGGMSETIPIGAGTEPTGIAYSPDAVWVADSGSGTVARINPADGRVVKITTGNGPQGVVVSAGRVWVSNSLDATVSEIDPNTNKVVHRIYVGPDPTAIVALAGDIWVANTTIDTVSRIDDQSRQVVQVVPVGSAPDALAVEGHSIWVANGSSGTVNRISVSANAAVVTDTLRACLAPRAIAMTAGTLWVSDSAGSLVALHPSAGAGCSEASLVGQPLALAAGTGGLWAAAGPSVTGHRGGTLRAVVGLSPSDPLDPAINYETLGWQVLSLTNDGLTGYRRVSGPQAQTVAADLATTIPPATDGGKTYTFQLRRGIRYSDGRLVRPIDFRWALERVFDARAGGDQQYTDIVGAAGCERQAQPVRCDLKQGIRIDTPARTVTFHLTRPDPDFLAKLSLPWANAVPKGVVAAPPRCHSPPCGYTAQPPPVPATGPYMIAPHHLGLGAQRGYLTLVRNPHFREWSADAQPSGYPDRIVFSFGLLPDSEARQIEQGKADWSPDTPPSSTVAHLLSTSPNRVHRNPLLGLAALALNPRTPPFTSTLARQAVNYAIDRATLARISGGIGAQPTCQILPPGMLGYVPYCPYTALPRVAIDRPGAWLAPNPVRALQLVKRSGTGGTPITLRLPPAGVAYAPAATRAGVAEFAHSIVTTLRHIGYPTHLKLGGGTPHSQMSIAYWLDDYPEPSNFLQLLFSCAKTDQQYNISGFPYCRASIDRQMSQALNAQSVDLTRAAVRWAAADRELTNQAPWVPLYTLTDTEITSNRVGNYQFSPQFGALLDQLWVRP